MFSPTSKSPIVLRYNPFMLDSLKCLFLVRNRPQKDPVIDSVEDKSVRAPVLRSQEFGLLKGAIPIGRLLWDPSFNYRITEWLDYSKYEIVPYIWAQNIELLQNSLRALDKHLSTSKTLVTNDSDYTIADASLGLDITPAIVSQQIDPSKYPAINQWYEGLFIRYPGMKDITNRAIGIMSGTPPKSESQVPRVLCVHGYRQSGSLFKLKLWAFMKLFKKKVEFIFMDSPHAIEDGGPADMEEDLPRGWWFSNENRTYSAFEESSIQLGLSESVNLILDTIRNEHIDGILCFSQGASLIAWMAMQGMLRDSSIKFIILVASFKSSSLEYSDNLPICGIPSLHVVGNGDQVIPSERSKEILEYFDKESSRVLFHSGGHFVPAKSDHKQIYLNFIESYA
uniref:Ovarian cancer-associated gene 2 protein homolog n=1 Tax=Caligus clemensi TaxID=344056 RepID=C1BZZ2_CALCM|nr:Ovarian cancer-associated gene 2 protein homolog [Caligus clemensi]